MGQGLSGECRTYNGYRVLQGQPRDRRVLHIERLFFSWLQSCLLHLRNVRIALYYLMLKLWFRFNKHIITIVLALLTTYSNVKLIVVAAAYLKSELSSELRH